MKGSSRSMPLGAPEAEVSGQLRGDPLRVIPLSLIIPVHGRQDKLDRAVASILRQKTRPGEVLVIDDGSEPPTTVPDALRSELDVRLVRHAANRGAAAARNTGMREAANDWVTFLDSDDFLLDNNSLALRWDAARSGADVPSDTKTIHGCAWLDVDAAEQPLMLRRPHGASNVHAFASGCWFSPGSCVILNAKAALAAAPQDERLSRFEDLDWFLALSLADFSLTTIPTPCVAVERTRRQNPRKVAEAADIIKRKWRGLSNDRTLLRRLEAYLDLEIAAARYHSGERAGALRALISSFAKVPRLSLQFSPGWDTERVPPPAGAGH